jgi:hypothetical protein
MDTIIKLVEQLRAMPGAFVDCNIGQGRDAVLQHIRTFYGEKETAFIDQYTVGGQQSYAALHEFVKPYQFPEDFLFFVWHYGGALIQSDTCNMLIHGDGPSCKDAYGWLLDTDDGLYENGIIAIGDMSFTEGHVRFLMDLSGVISRYSILCLPTWTHPGIQEIDILRNPHAYAHTWQKQASSFTEWLAGTVVNGNYLSLVDAAREYRSQQSKI